MFPDLMQISPRLLALPAHHALSSASRVTCAQPRSGASGSSTWPNDEESRAVSFLGSANGVGRAGKALLRHRVITATAGAATAVLVVGCAYAATSSNGSGHETLANVSNNSPATTQHVTTKTKPKVAPVAPLKLVSVTSP